MENLLDEQLQEMRQGHVAVHPAPEIRNMVRQIIYWCPTAVDYHTLEWSTERILRDHWNRNHPRFGHLFDWYLDVGQRQIAKSERGMMISFSNSDHNNIQIPFIHWTHRFRHDSATHLRGLFDAPNLQERLQQLGITHSWAPELPTMMLLADANPAIIQSDSDKYISYAENKYDELTALVIVKLAEAWDNRDNNTVRVITDLYEVAREFLFGDALHALLQLHRSDYETAFPNGMLNERAEYAELRATERPVMISRVTWDELYLYWEDFDDSLLNDDIRKGRDSYGDNVSVGYHMGIMKLHWLMPVRADGSLCDGQMPNYSNTVKHFIYGYNYTPPMRPWRYIDSDSNSDGDVDHDTERDNNNDIGSYIGAIQSSARRSSNRTTSQANSTIQQANITLNDAKEARNEIDTRADTTCCGMNFRAIEYTGKVCDVSPFHSDLESMKNIPIATCATVYQDPVSLRQYILVYNEALYFGNTMGHSLLNPNQMRANGIDVWDNPYDKERDFGIETDLVLIPFESSGTVVGFKSRVPIDDELLSLPHIVMTNSVEWDPQQINMPGSKKRSWIEDNELFINQVNRNISSVTVRDIHRHETDLALNSISEGLVEQQLVERMIACVNISEVASRERHSKHTPERVSKLWRISLDKAKQLLANTTQNGIRTAASPLHKRYKILTGMHRNDFGGKWAIDHMPSGVKSIRGHTGAFVISNGTFTYLLPQKSKNDECQTDTLSKFIQDTGGVPHDLRADWAFASKHTEFAKLVKKKDIDLTWAEPGRKNQLRSVDTEIREIRRTWHRMRVEMNIPRRVWDFALEDITERRKFLPRGKDGRTGYEIVTGKTPDISELLDFNFWDLVWYWVKEHPGTGDDARQLARWVGIAHRVGTDMCYWLMPVSGIPIADTSVQHVTQDDMAKPGIKTQVDEFNAKLEERLDDTKFIISQDKVEMDMDDIHDDINNNAATYGDGGRTPEDTEEKEPRVEPGDVEPEIYDKYIGAEIILDHDEANESNIVTRQKATVVRRVVDESGTPVGSAHNNPLLDTREYEIELEDGTTDRIFANKIAENLWTQCDSEGRQFQIIEGISDHRKTDRALSADDGYTISSNGRKVPKQTTVGWDILVEFKDSTTAWIPLKEVKESNPLEMADYAVANKIAEEPAFAWWVPTVLRKRKRMINAVKKKYWRTTHKFGIRLPHSVKEALEIDKANGNTYWEDAIKKEMGKAQVSYTAVDGCTPEDVRNGDVPSLNGFQEIKCHIVFDVKIDFTRKARFVAGGHMTQTPTSLTYSSVVSRDSVKIAFLIAALNDLDLMACDIGNAYLNAPCREKIWFEAGAECGEHKGKVMKLVRALYGLKSSGAAWRAMFSTFIEQNLKFKSTRIDPDVYIRRNNKESGEPYYEMLLVYVDDVLLISHVPNDVMEKIASEFEIKNNEWGPPEFYLGAGIEKFTVYNDSGIVGNFWSMTSKKFVDNLVKTVEDMLAEDGRELKSKSFSRKHKGALPPNYKPELDTTDECNEKNASRFRQIIGLLRWAIELGRFDILTEVAFMSQYQAAPRLGHLEALYSIVYFLKMNSFKRVVFDPTRPFIDESRFTEHDWTEFYGDMKEEDPPDMPEPLGKPVLLVHLWMQTTPEMLSHADHTLEYLFSLTMHLSFLLARNRTLLSPLHLVPNWSDNVYYGIWL